MESMKVSTRKFRIGPVGLGAVIGGAVAFVLVGAIVDVLWVALGAIVGAGLGIGAGRLFHRAAATVTAGELEQEPKTQLLEEARKLDIPGRTTMDKETLAREVAERKVS